MMAVKIRCPTADQLYSERDKIAKASLRAAFAEARKLAKWAGDRIPSGPTAGALKGDIYGAGDLELAIAMIIARVRDETTAKVLWGSLSRRRGLNTKVIQARRKAKRKRDRLDRLDHYEAQRKMMPP